jgi:TonB-dependent Receptor Plug Domain/CarboxypepD_reg-like domain
MKMKTIIYLFIFVQFVINVQAQTANTPKIIIGYVRDSLTQEALIGATVSLQNTSIGLVSNESGFFSLSYTLTTDAPILNISYIGYTKKQVQLPIKSIDGQLLTIGLLPQSNLKTVVVSAEKTAMERNEMSVVQIPMTQVRLLPRLFGETDFMRALQLMPGVQQGREGASALFVRGGTPDQNLILLDEMPLYNVNHLGGFLSVFDDNAINSFKLYKGGFPARYGGRLSSILDVRMKDGNTEQIHGAVQLGLLTAKAFVEGPLTKDKKTSFFASLRRGNMDLLIDAYDKIQASRNAYIGSKTDAYYLIYDANVKVTHRFSDRDRLSLTAYWGEDRLSIKNRFEGYNFSTRETYTSSSKSGLAWGNTLLSARHTHVFSPKIFATATLGYTHFDYTAENDYEYLTPTLTQNTGFNFNSSIEDVSLRANVEYKPFANWKATFGTVLTHHVFTPSSTVTSSYQQFEPKTERTINRINAPELQFYTENEVEFNRYISGNIGLHYAIYALNPATTFQSVQPRALLNIRPNKAIAIKLGASKMVQNVHLLTNSGIGLPVDIWVPATAAAPPQSAWQYNIGVEGGLKKYGIEWSVEGFYKTLDDLIDYANGSTFFFGSTDWETKIDTKGKGRVYGAEALLKKNMGKTTGWLGYTYSVNQRQYTAQNNGAPYPFRYDQPNAVSLVVLHQFSERVSLSATWAYHTGNAYTLPNSGYYSYLYESNPLYIEPPRFNTAYYPSKNNYRMPDYHRLDLNLNIKTKPRPDKKKRYKKGVLLNKKQPVRFSSEWNIGVYNAYNSQNPYYIYVEANSMGDYKLKSYTLFPALPSISYMLKW